jgi:predicted polyphosphate/ATP-dependent NAD kinase
MRIGFLVNPIAGLGGAVGLKGTDGKVQEALTRGARMQAGDRAAGTLALLKGTGIRLLTCSGAMGEEPAEKAGFSDYDVVYRYDGQSTAQDTRDAVRIFIGSGVDVILFCGGDGTARDVAGVAGKDVPILGIPAGVKMYSAVFAVSPAEAASILRTADNARFRDGEVIDVDEEAYRRGELVTRLYGYARVPYIPEKVQEPKSVFESQNEEQAKDDIAAFIIELMRDDTLYILGAGTTTAHIAKKAGVEKTLLGIDVMKGRRLVARDADEKTILDLIQDHPPVKIILSPLGAQGFILGRGTQPLSADVVRKVGISNIIVLATPAKLARTPVLYLDTGDPALDASFGNHIRVISGYRIAQRKRVHRPAS